LKSTSHRLFIQAPQYAATLSPEDQDPALLEILKQLMFVTDEAECRDIELVKMVDFISKSGSLFEVQAVRIIPYTLLHLLSLLL
jgi:hypothetical protein